MTVLGSTLSTEVICPVGAILPYAGSTAPAGGTWLLAQGQAVSRATYSALFAVCGTTYGAGDGTTTFNLPDLQGRMPVGVGTNADVSALNANDGLANASRSPKHTHGHTLTLPNHSHSHSLTLPNHAHSHTLTLPNHVHSVGSYTAPDHVHNVPVLLPNHSHTYTGGTDGAQGSPNAYGAPFGASFSAAVVSHFHNFSGTTSSNGAVLINANSDNNSTILTLTGSSGNPTTTPGVGGSVGNPTSNPSIGGTVDNPTTNPAITGAISSAGGGFIALQFIIKAT